MWGKITTKLHSPKFAKANQSDTALDRYNKVMSLDFSDGPNKRPRLPREASDDSRYNITPHTMMAFIEPLALESIAGPKAPEPTVIITAPTPPWASVAGSRRGSEQEDGSKLTHKKAASDTLCVPNQARGDALRRVKETALALEAIGRALQNIEMQAASRPPTPPPKKPVVNYSYPFSRQPRHDADTPTDALDD